MLLPVLMQTLDARGGSSMAMVEIKTWKGCFTRRPDVHPHNSSDSQIDLQTLVQHVFFLLP